MSRLALVIALALFAAPALAQTTLSGDLRGVTRNASVTGIQGESVVYYGTTPQGSIFFKGASGWTSLAPGTANYVLKAAGAGADPLWSALSVASADITDGTIVNADVSASAAIDYSKIGGLSYPVVLGRVTPSAGAAEAMALGGTPAALGSSASAGTDNYVARTDHVHKGIVGQLLGSSLDSGNGNATINVTGTDISASASGGVLTIQGGAVTPGGFSGGYVTRSGGNLLFSPDKSNVFRTYNGSAWIPNTIPDAGVTGNVSCTGLTARTPYFAYAYSDNGTVSLNVTTTEPTTQNGINVCTGYTSRLLVARCYTNDAGDITTPTQNVTGSLICNVFNRKPVKIWRVDTTDSWTYNSSTVRAANGSFSNRVEFVASGDDYISARVEVLAGNQSTPAPVGIGLDTTTANNATFIIRSNPSAFSTACATYFAKPSAGFHYLQWTENVENNGTSKTFYGDAGLPASMLNGLVAEVMQ